MIIDKTPDQLKMEYALWTRKAVMELIQQETGLCDMVHVSLVRGNCEDLGSQEEITAYLSEDTDAYIPSISGTLACGGDSGRGLEIAEICNNGEDDDGDGRIDCADKKDCSGQQAKRVSVLQLTQKSEHPPASCP